MKRPEREPERRASDPMSRAVDQERWRAQRVNTQGNPDQQDETEQEELLSANPLEWWADVDALEDARFATGPLIGVDATGGPLLDLFPPMAPPTARPVYPTAHPEAWPVYPAAPPTQRSATRPAYPPAPEVPGGNTSPKPFDGGAFDSNRRFSPAPPLQTPAYPPVRERAPGHAPVSRAAPQSAALPAHQSAPLESDDTSYIPAWKVSTARMPAIVARAETVVTIVRRLMKSSGLYAIAALGGPAVSLALTPYLAHNMPVSDYGLLAVLNTSISLFAGLTQLGLGPAFFRAYNYDYSSAKDRQSVIASSSLLMMALSGLFLVIALPLAPFFAGLLVRGGGAAVEKDVVIACLVIAILNLSVPAFAWLRAENRALAFSLVSMLNVLVTLGGSIILVSGFHRGIAGAMIANGAGYAAVVIVTLIPMLMRSRLRFSPRVALSMLAFGAPLTLSVIAVWVLQLSDRYLLAFLGDFSQTASYSVAYSLGSVLSTIVLSPFSLAWPTAMYSIAKRSDAPRVFQQVFRWFTAVLLFAAFGLSLGSTLLLDLLFPPSYRSAAPVIPIVAASIALYGTYTVVMVGANVRRMTWMTSVFTAIAAVVNVALNLVLIPQFGAMGAAASTFFAYLALVVIAYFANQRIYPVPFEVTRAAFAGLMGIAMYYLIAQAPDLLRQQLGMLSPMLSETRTALALWVVGLLVYGVWLYMLLQIRTINFRVNPAIVRRLLRRSVSRATEPALSEDAYVRR